MNDLTAELRNIANQYLANETRVCASEERRITFPPIVLPDGVSLYSAFAAIHNVYTRNQRAQE